MAGTLSDTDRLRQGRIALANRLSQSGAWWQRLGHAKLEQEDTDGHDCIRTGRRLMAISAVLRSTAYAGYVDLETLAIVSRKPSVQAAQMIVDRLPRGQIPGYRER